MLNALIRFSLKNRLLVLAGAALVVAYGGWVIVHLPVDVLPDLNRPTVTIMTEAEGFAPEEVETQISLPIETAMNGAPGVTRVRSTSGIGLSVVYVEFDWTTKILVDRQLVAERLQTAAEVLPTGIKPVMGPIASIMGEIMLLGVASDTGETQPLEVRSMADWVVRPRLLTIPGVAQVIPIGGGVRQYQVEVDPQKIRALGLTLEEVETAVRGAQGNTTGGFVERRGMEFLVRNIGRTSAIEDIANTPVASRSGAPILLKNIAEVHFGPRVKRGDASVNGKPAVIMSIQKQPGADTTTLTAEVEKALAELQPSLPKDVKLVPLFKQSNFIQSAIGNVTSALRDGAVLVVIVLFLFLLNFRTTAITLTAIPLSLVVTALVMKAFGISVNTMTLGGLAVAIGELVDDAIVDVENVFRRLKENRVLEKPRPMLQVIYEASSEVRNSIVFATIIVVLVFVPLFALSGIEGKLFAPLGIAYIVSIVASLVVSLTVTPALCSFLLPHAKATAHETDGFLVRFLKNVDRGLLHWTLTHPGKVIAGAVGLVIVAAVGIPFMGTEFLPPFNEGTATINLLAVPGTSLEESNRLGTAAEKLLLEVPEVLSTGRRTGRAELDEHAEGVHYSEIDVDMKKSKRTREEVLADIRQRLDSLPGVLVNIGQPISHRIDHLLSGVRAQIAVKIFGDDLDGLRTKAAEIRNVMGTIAGVTDLQIEQQVYVPQIRIDVDRNRANRFGVAAGTLTERLQTAFQGQVVGQVLDRQRSYDLVVRYAAGERGSVQEIGRALIDTPRGSKVPLSALARVSESAGPNVINRENVRRRIVVSANTQGRDLGSIVKEIQSRVASDVHFAPGEYVTYGGQFESQAAATRLIALLSLFSLAGMFLVLYTHFKSTMIVSQILVNIPLAMIGAVAAVWLTGGVFSVASLVGFITLTGIASRNTIMMISHYLHLMEVEGEKFSKEMIVRGSLERLVPVLMTALTAGLALIPLVLAKGEPGKEILYPVATVILGGLISSTALDMIVTPAVFFRFGQKAATRFIASHHNDPWHEGDSK